jgi:FkbM family methyltransferase
MSFISYAQNFEDVMLWRALKHVKCGFYVDVGANDPEIDSVTKAFYERGWHGINVEPVEQWYKKLAEQRPRDINLPIAVGDKPGEMVLYELPDTGLSTLDRATAERHEVEGGYEKIEHKISVKTLTDICLEYHVAPIHFLKIDVEGAEKLVLQGVDFNKIRPWIVVVESTLPLSQEENYKEWTPVLEKSGYEFVYFDGLNRYYVAGERGDLKDSFSIPPNVFDGFLLSGKASHAFYKLVETHYQKQILVAEEQTRQQVQRAEAAEELVSQQVQRAEAAEEQARQQVQRAEAAEERAKQAEAGLHAVSVSRSWRMTKPLRLTGKAVRWFVRGTVAWLTFTPMSRPRRVVRQIVIHLKRYVSSHPGLKALALRLLTPFPGLKSRLKNVGSPIPIAETLPISNDGRENLSPRARQIYSDLKCAIEQRQKEQN